MFLANADPEADLAVMRAARENIRQIAPKRLVLISSIAVLADSRGVYEDSPAQDTEGLPAYGKTVCNWSTGCARTSPTRSLCACPHCTAPASGKTSSLTCTPSPRPCSDRKIQRAGGKIAACQISLRAGGQRLLQAERHRRPGSAARFFAANDFNALAFTDARSRYQFYNLGRLWSDMEAARAADVKLLHLCTPPVSAAEVYTAVTGKADWRNELPKPPFDYDLRSRHAALLGGSGDYLCTKQQELDDITRFMRSWRD